MKFNNREIASYGANKVGHADKEGALWMRETEGAVIKKKENYHKRWLTLCGNLLFYSKEETKDSPLVGVIVLERAQVESEAYSGNRNAFRITFQNSEDGYWFYTDSAREADEWIRLLNCTSYEYLRIKFTELRGQLMHLTGKDPLGMGGPISDWSLTFKPAMLASAPGYDGEPIFELLLTCSSLVGWVNEVAPPSSLIVTHCMTPPQAYWIRYAQTELVERNCDPQFLTPVVFFEGSIYSGTQLKFDVFDICKHNSSLMRPLGQCQCTIQDLIKDPHRLNRFELKYDDKVSGYLLIRTKMAKSSNTIVKTPQKVQTGKLIDVSPPPSTSPSHNTQDSLSQTSISSSFTFRSPIDNIVVRPFEFPRWDEPESVLRVTEIMGEGLFTFTLPMQILELCIAEENVSIGQFSTLTGLSEHWEIVRQEVILELRGLVEHYWKSREAVQLEAESGKLYKKSVIKDNSLLEFVPVNLHVQEMKVSSDEDEKERVMYTCVTVGCPTAYSLKYRHGGLARLQHSYPMLAASSASFSPATENKSLRVKHILRRFSQHQISIKKCSKRLVEGAKKGDHGELRTSVRSVADTIAALENHCNSNIVKDALKDWYKALDVNKIPSFITGLTNLDPKSILSLVEEHMVCVEAQVDGVIRSELSPDDSSAQLEGPVSDLLKAIDQTLEIFQTVIYFVLLKDFYMLQTNKIPVGLKGFKHRRDIVFSQAVTSATTSFVMKILRSIGSKQFLTQIQELGFLIHWESLLSTQGDELGMLDDFIIAISDLNSLKFKFVLADSLSDLPRCHGTRYKVTVEIPLQSAMFRILPSALREGKEINTVAVLFTQGINEQQSIADAVGDTHLQDQVNITHYQRLSQYCDKFRERFGTTGLKMAQKSKKVNELLQQLRAQIHLRKTKNTDILTLSAELCRLLECGRITSCKSAKDRTAMSVTLEEVNILLSLKMDQAHVQQALDSMRSNGTRIRNAEKNVGVPLYAFNALQVVMLPKTYRPPVGTYKNLQT